MTAMVWPRPTDWPRLRVSETTRPAMAADTCSSAPADADEHKGEEGKYEKYFSPEPGQGD